VIHMNEPAGRRLFERAGLDFDAMMLAANVRGFKAVSTPLQARLDHDAEVRTITSHNVIAHIPGRDPGDECVIYTGHWDHVGRNDQLEGDKIFNGAVDNATGTAALLTLARAFATLPEPPRRSIYLVATTAEEKGLLGAEYLARHPIVSLEQTVAVLNLDALFPFGEFDAMTVTGFGASEIEDVLAASAGRLGRTLQPESSPEVGAYYRSDHYPFAKRGVPALFAVGNPRRDRADADTVALNRFRNYVAHGYHKPADEYDAATWDMRGIEGDVRVYFETGWRIAESELYPNFRYGNEFRPLRDRMRALPQPKP
jgi:Zn-dependent M28 family amino/carboxypeptidase